MLIALVARGCRARLQLAGQTALWNVPKTRNAKRVPPRMTDWAATGADLQFEVPNFQQAREAGGSHEQL